MKTYASAPACFEEAIGRRVTDDFALRYGEQMRLLALLQAWESIFRDLSRNADSLPLAVLQPSEHLVKHSLVYSANVGIRVPARVTDEYWAVDIPDTYVDFLRKYHRLVRRDVACLVMATLRRIDSLDRDDDLHEFDPATFGCASVSEGLFSSAPADALHFKVLLPRVAGTRLEDLVALMQDEEIFHRYHDALNLLNLRRAGRSPEQKLNEIILEVDDRTRELNAKFKQLAKRTTWQAIRAVGTLSFTGFTYLFPEGLGAPARAVLGSLSALAIADGIVGIVQSNEELTANPYYFSYAIDEKSGSA